jgi:hypothetical protein
MSLGEVRPRGLPYSVTMSLGEVRPRGLPYSVTTSLGEIRASTGCLTRPLLHWVRHALRIALLGYCSTGLDTF